MHRLFEKSRKTVLAIATPRSFLQNRIMSTVYLSTAYFAPVSYYASFLRYDRIVIEQWCNYTKQTYRNRCHIAGANGLLALSVPIVKPDTIKCPTRMEAFALECYRFGLRVLPFFRILPRRYTPVLREAVRISIGFQ